MVTVNKKIALNTGTATFELLGLSTDTKPTGKFSGYTVGENSVYLELDTGKLYYYKGSEWEEMSMSGGGAGLPAVTDEDNGKVLGVVDGDWGKMEIGGYNVILTSNGEGGYTAAINGETVTLSELLVMAAAHKPLRVYVDIDNGRYITAPLTMWSTVGMGATDMIAFTCPILLGTDTGVAAASCVDNGSGGAWTVGTV